MTDEALPRFHIHVDTHIPRLVDALADVLRTAPSEDPMVPEQIVVQSPGMARWLSLELAGRLGIAAHHENPTPRTILDRAFSAVIEGDDIETRRAYDADRLTWAVAATLADESLVEPELEPLRRYVGDTDLDPRGLKPLQLARRIAVAFDDYAVYRPHMVLDWDAGNDRGPDEQPLCPEDRWQPVLWRAVDERVGGGKHFAARRQRFLDKLSPDGLRGRRFPRRLCLFGLSSLPPSYVSAFWALAEQGAVEIHVFLLTPSAVLWQDLRRRGETARGWLNEPPEVAEKALGDVLAHPLLSSQGRVALGFQSALAGLAPRATIHGPPLAPTRATDPARPTAPTTSFTPTSDAPTTAVDHAPSVLHRIQAGLRAGEPPDGLEGATRPPLALEDDSFRVHSCHGPMREVEVLRDQILDWLCKDPTLTPADIVVLAPAIEQYAPYIEATFGVEHSDPSYIPFRIADRSSATAETVTLAFSRILDLLRGRMSAPEIVDLLELPPVRARFGIAAEAVESLRERVREAGIRWGADGEHRAEVDQPALHEHTWRFGLDRLLLGHAWAGEEGGLFAGAAPVGDVEGGEAEQIGRLADLCETLFDFRKKLSGEHRVGEWRDRLLELLDATIQPSWDEAWQAERLRRALHGLVERATEARFDRPVDLEVVRPELADGAGGDEPPRGFITGAMTFCALVPMRSVPFRNVAMLGMSDQAYPRTGHRAGFDLLERSPHLGDLSPREVDRALILEALLAAEDRLAITYVGQSARDNRVLPPSVVVSELLDLAADLLDPPLESETPTDGTVPGQQDDASDRADRVRRRLLVSHAIQPFSPHYFERTEDERARTFSYAERYLRTAKAVATARKPAPPFFQRPLAGRDGVEGEARPVLRLSQLGRFLTNPARTLLQERLSLYLGEEDAPLESREPLALDGLSRWQVGMTILPHLIEGQEADSTYPIVRASGMLPAGTTGQVAFEDVSATAKTIALAARRHGAAVEEAPPLRYEMPIGDHTLTGTLRGIRPHARVEIGFGSAGGRRELDAWLVHLVMTLLREGHGRLATLEGERLPPQVAKQRIPARSILVARARNEAHVAAFGTVEDPLDCLEGFVALIEPGLRQPLPLFERASRTYAEARGKDKSEWQARLDASKVFLVDPFRPFTDQANAYVRQAWGDADPTRDEAPDGAAYRDLARLERAGGESEEKGWPKDDPALRFTVLAEQVYGGLLQAQEVLDA